MVAGRLEDSGLGYLKESAGLGGPWGSPEQSWAESGGKERESAGWILDPPVLTP